MIIRNHLIVTTALACGILLFLAWIASFELWMRLHARQSRLAPACLKFSNFLGRAGGVVLAPSLVICAFYAFKEGDALP